MKWHISSWLFTNDFLPFVIYMVEWSLHNKKFHFLSIHNSWKTEPCRFLFEATVLIKSGYYIVPSFSTALISTDMNIWICRYSCRILPGSVLCTTSLELLSEKITSPLRKIRLKLFFAKKKEVYPRKNLLQKNNSEAVSR